MAVNARSLRLKEMPVRPPGMPVRPVTRKLTSNLPGTGSPAFKLAEYKRRQAKAAGQMALQRQAGIAAENMKRSQAAAQRRSKRAASKVGATLRKIY